MATAEIVQSPKETKETERRNNTDRRIGASSYGRQDGSFRRQTRGKVCAAPGEGIWVTAMAMPTCQARCERLRLFTRFSKLFWRFFWLVWCSYFLVLRGFFSAGLVFCSFAFFFGFCCNCRLGFVGIFVCLLVCLGDFWVGGFWFLFSGFFSILLCFGFFSKSLHFQVDPRRCPGAASPGAAAALYICRRHSPV